MVRDSDRAFDCTCILELEKQDTSELDVCGVVKVECDIERDTTVTWVCDPVLLVCSVWNHALCGSLSILHLQQSASNWCSNKVSLKLGNLGGNSVHHRGSLSSNLIISSPHSG